MKSTPSQDVTGLLRAWSRGDPEAAEKLVPLVYDALRRRAAWHLGRERRDHTLRPTALVHEVYLRLAGQSEAARENRAQFFAVAARVMSGQVPADQHRQAQAEAVGVDRMTGPWLVEQDRPHP